MVIDLPDAGPHEVMKSNMCKAFSMRRRRLLLDAGVVALLGLAGFASVLWLTNPTPGVTWENFRLLRKGMAGRNVDRLLGEPNWVSEDGRYRLWRGEQIKIRLVFAGDWLWLGRAQSQGDPRFGQLEVLHTDESFLDRIREWLPW